MVHKYLLFQIMTTHLAYLKRQTYEVNISRSAMLRKRGDAVRSEITFRSTSWDRQTAVRRPRDKNFGPFDLQLIPDVLATLFILSKSECGSLCR